jgi:formylglycine-generating enzyme required for sulfatase activity
MVTTIATIAQPALARQASSFRGRQTGDARKVDAIDLCWCPPGRFVMGSPRSEPERRPGEDQVEVTLTRGFWMAKFEATQGLWKRVAGELPGPLTRSCRLAMTCRLATSTFPRRKISVGG